MESSAPLFRLGIIGAGHIGTVHARHASRLPDVTVTAIADAHVERAEALAQTAGATAFDSADALLQTDLDAVIVAVPTAQHRAIVEMALAAGKHVLCEKPLALTLADCETLITASEIAGKVLAVGQVVRFFPEYANAKHLLDGGAVGKPAAVRTRRAGRYPSTLWFTDPAQSGGILVDLLVHDFDFLQWCFGPVIRVHAHIASSEGLEYALITLRHESGVIGHVEGIWGEPGGFHTTFEISGDGGMLVHDSRRATTLVRGLQSAGTAVASSGPLAPHDDPYYRQLSAFVEAVRVGGAPAVSAQDARRAIAVAIAAQESARTGKAVTL